MHLWKVWSSTHAHSHRQIRKTLTVSESNFSLYLALNLIFLAPAQSTRPQSTNCTCVIKMDRCARQRWVGVGVGAFDPFSVPRPQPTGYRSIIYKIKNKSLFLYDFCFSCRYQIGHFYFGFPPQLTINRLPIDRVTVRLLPPPAPGRKPCFQEASVCLPAGEQRLPFPLACLLF